MDLALFDFDGTITEVGTYPLFLRYAVPKGRQVAGALALGPIIAGYHAGIVSSEAIRPPMSWVALWRAPVERIERLGAQFAAEVLPGLVRPEARERIAWHQARGDRVVVVSASLDVYLGPWCRAMGVEMIATQLTSRRGLLTGRYLEGDCCGAEKARRIRAGYAIADYDTIYAYGDTSEDREMLDLAHVRYLGWRRVDGGAAAEESSRHRAPTGA